MSIFVSFLTASVWAFSVGAMGLILFRWISGRRVALETVKHATHAVALLGTLHAFMLVVNFLNGLGGIFSLPESAQGIGTLTVLSVLWGLAYLGSMFVLPPIFWIRKVRQSSLLSFVLLLPLAALPVAGYFLLSTLLGIFPVTEPWKFIGFTPMYAIIALSVFIILYFFIYQAKKKDYDEADGVKETKVSDDDDEGDEIEVED